MPGPESSHPDLQRGVLVVGAGPVGLTLTCELERRGVAVRVIDQEDGPTPPAQSRALGIHARTLEALGGLGVAPDLVRQGRRVQAVNVWDRGRRFARLQLDFTALETPYPFVLILSQGATEQRLVEKLTELGAGVEWCTRLIEFHQDPEGVTARVCGPDGAEREVRAAYLVGCDGAHSTVRHQLELNFAGSPYEEKFLLADVRLRWDLAPDEGHLLLTPEGLVPALPLPAPGWWRLIDATGAGEATDPEAIAARFRCLLREAGLEGASIEETLWASAFRIHRRATERLRVGRCFLAGDAAHIHSPVGGQGMNIGMQDACNLAWKLSLVLAGAAPESLLDSYEAERLPVAQSVVRGTHWATRVVLLRNPLARALRNRLASWISRSGAVRRRLTRELSELGMNYRGSPIVAEDRSGAWGGPQPGDRIPDCEIADASGPARLFDVLRGADHTLLCFEGAESGGAPRAWVTTIAALIHERFAPRITIRRVVSHRPEVSPSADLPILVDAAGVLHRRFHATSPCLYLIRPDGYLGYRSRPPDASRLEHYLQRVMPR